MSKADELYTRIAQCAPRIAAIGRGDVLGVARAREELRDLRLEALALEVDGRALPDVAMSIRKIELPEPTHPELNDLWRELLASMAQKGFKVA